MVKTVPTRSAVPSISRGRDGEALAGYEQDGLVVLRACRCGSWGPAGRRGCRWACFLLRDGAHHVDELGLLLVGAVGEVEAGDVEAGADELAEDLGGAEAGPRVATILARRIAALSRARR